MSKMVDKIEKPVISILVPTRNLESLIRTCLNSLVEQTYKKIEILCIDDHSEDGTREIIEEYAEKDTRIKLLDSPAKGLSAARNFGMKQMRGKYMMLCDGDDYYEPTTCEKMLDAIERNGADLAVCEVNMVYQACREQRFYDEDYCNLKYSGLQKVDRILLEQTNVLPWNKIYRKSIIDKYELEFPDGRFYEDAYFGYAYLCMSKTVYFVRERLYNYLRRPGSAMARTWDKNDDWDVAIDHLYIIIALYDFLKKEGVFEKWAEFFWGRFQAYERLALKFSKTKESKKAAQELAAEFIHEHKGDFALASADTKGAIADMTPGLPANRVTQVKKAILKLLPTYNMQIQNMRRLEELEKRNTALAKRLTELLERSAEN